MIKSIFKNELGNKITIIIKNKRDTGTNFKTKEEFKFTGVSISIEGPSSVSENVITNQEAEELYMALDKFLFDGEKK
jgi:hypothetical protein